MKEEPLLNNSISNRAVKRNSSREENEELCHFASVKSSGHEPLFCHSMPEVGRWNVGMGSVLWQLSDTVSDCGLCALTLSSASGVVL